MRIVKGKISSRKPSLVLIARLASFNGILQVTCDMAKPKRCDSYASVARLRPRKIHGAQKNTFFHKDLQSVNEWDFKTPPPVSQAPPLHSLCPARTIIQGYSTSYFTVRLVTTVLVHLCTCELIDAKPKAPTHGMPSRGSEPFSRTLFSLNAPPYYWQYRA